MFDIRIIADDPELNAQVPAPVPLGEGDGHHAAALLHLQDLRVQGDQQADQGGGKLKWFGFRSAHSSQ